MSLILLLELSRTYTLSNVKSIFENKKNKLKIPKITALEKDYFLNNDTILNNATLNSTFLNIKKAEVKNNLENKESKDIFPSFAEFMRKKKKREEELLLKYFERAEENERIMREKYDKINPTSKDLILLNNVQTIEWSKNWIHNMVCYTNSFPKFMYQDMFLMRDFARENYTNKYFYIGYFPSDIRLMHGPYYIGSFELIPQDREFQAHLIIQNPNYIIEDELNTSRIYSFKQELINMANDALVFFKFSNLKNSSDGRYYYSWLYEK